MKILLITPFYAPGVGGSTRLLVDIVNYFCAKGHQLDVMTYGDSNAPDCHAFDKAQSYRVIRIPAQAGANRSSVVMLRQIFSLLRTNRYDLVFCGVAFPITILVWAATRLVRTPYMFYSYSEDVTCVMQSPKKRRLLLWAVRKARAAMALSRFTENHLRDLQVPDSRLHLVPPWIDVEPYEQVKPEEIEALRARFGLTNKRVLLTVARLMERKGHDRIVEALPDVCARFPDVQYLIVGKGDPARLQKLAASKGIGDRVTIADYVADSELPALYALCDVYAMTSRWDPVSKEVEGFGIVYLEASASGKPSIAGSEGGCPDAVQDGKTGFIVDPNSVPQIRDALMKLFADRNCATAWEKRADNGYEKTLHMMCNWRASNNWLCKVPERANAPLGK